MISPHLKLLKIKIIRTPKSLEDWFSFKARIHEEDGKEGIEKNQLLS